jgi:phosphonate transport system permease protein
VDRMSVALSRPLPWRKLAALLLAIAAIVAMSFWLALDVGSLFSKDTFAAMGTVFARMWPPRLDDRTLANAATGTLETLSMSIVGTLLGAVVGLVLMPFCCETLFARGPLVDEEERSAGRRAAAALVHHGVRLVANVLRTVPYFVWAMLFWFMVGQGTFPGALAIAVHTGGVIARNYAQALDQLDPRPLSALRSGGARRTHVFLFGMLPAARTALASFTLYRWEVNIRESTVLGLVGGGGLGFHLFYAIGIFDWRAAGTHLAAIMILVLAVDALSAFVRRRLA